MAATQPGLMMFSCGDFTSPVLGYSTRSEQMRERVPGTELMLSRPSGGPLHFVTIKLPWNQWDENELPVEGTHVNATISEPNESVQFGADVLRVRFRLRDGFVNILPGSMLGIGVNRDAGCPRELTPEQFRDLLSSLDRPRVVLHPDKIQLQIELLLANTEG